MKSEGVFIQILAVLIIGALIYFSGPLIYKKIQQIFDDVGRRPAAPSGLETQ